MARFKIELPTELINQFESLNRDTEKMIEEMTEAGAKVVYDNVVENMQSSFNDANKLTPYLKITRTYRTPSDGGINTKVGFYGYYKDKTFTVRNKKNDTIYSYVGVPVPLIARAREFGSSSGECRYKHATFIKLYNYNRTYRYHKRYIYSHIFSTI